MATPKGAYDHEAEDVAPTLSELAISVESLAGEVASAKVATDVSNLNVLALTKTINAVFDRTTAIEEKADKAETRADEVARDVVPRRKRRAYTAVVAAVAVLLSCGVWKSIDLGNRIKTQNQVQVDGQRFTNLEVCYSIDLTYQKLAGFYDQIVKSSEDAARRAEVSPGATEQVRALAEQSAASAADFAAVGKAALTPPDCSTLPKPKRTPTP